MSVISILLLTPDEIVPTLYGKTYNLKIITSFSRNQPILLRILDFTTICFVSILYSVFNEHLCIIHSAFCIMHSALRSFASLVGPSGLEPPLLTYPFVSLREKPLSLYNGFDNRLSSMVGPSGLEPPTSCLSGTRSNLLSYDPMWLVWFSHLVWWR